MEYRTQKDKGVAKSVNMSENQVTHYGRHLAKGEIDLINEKIKEEDCFYL